MMIKFRFLICGLISLLFITGCASTKFGSFGNLKQDSSTREDVRQLLGEPENIQHGDSEEIWEYLFVEQSRRDRDSQRNALKVLIYFDDKVLKNYKIYPTEGVAGSEVSSPRPEPMKPRGPMPPLPPPRPRFR